MSVFKKPKKNFRRRAAEFIDEEEEGNGENEKIDVEVDTPVQIHTTVSKPKEKQKDKRKTVLSFEEDLNEDDGEVFQVKKSSHSKKIMKLLDRERKKKKEGKRDDKADILDISERKKGDTSDLVIVLKNTEMPRILNGREAEAAEPEGLSSEDEEKHPKFSQSDHVKLLLESGRIPDAAMIHAARKRRQLAREMGGEYVPIETKTDNTKSRLVRDDDDNDASDDERITMEVNTAARDKEKRREAFLAAQDEGVGEESDKGEDDEWESQQIRKAVTGAQLAAVQQETIFAQQYTMQPTILVPAVLQTDIPTMSSSSMNSGAYIDAQGSVSNVDALYTMKSEITTPQTIANKLKDRLISLKEVHRQHTLEKDQVAADLLSLQTEQQKLEREAPSLAERFRFYQELRGYVTDLVECLDEKLPVITALEQRLLNLLKRRAEELMERRRQDVRDQAEELSPLFRSGASNTNRRTREEEEQRTRRAAEREGRRTRRRRAREMKNTARHVEGMSSDDEMTELESTAFRTSKETIENDARLVFEDVVEEFCTLRGVMKRFEEWRGTDPNAYQEAYVSLCLPKVLGPIIRLKILSWNPLEETSEFERHKWYDCLLLYGLSESETEESLRKDPDLKLVPLIVEKVLLPKVEQLVIAQWDPVSTLQTLRVVGLLNRLVQEYPTLGPESKPLHSLVKSVIDKMKNAVENDIFIPIYTRQISDSRSGNMGQFFQRQFASAVKLLRNLLSFQGIVSDRVLGEVALGSLLNRYLLMALRTCEAMDAADKCNMIVTTFPRWWFQQNCCLPQLTMFTNQLKTIAQGLDINTPGGRDALENVTKMLQALLPSTAT